MSEIKPNNLKKKMVATFHKNGSQNNIAFFRYFYLDFYRNFGFVKLWANGHYTE